MLTFTIVLRSVGRGLYEAYHGSDLLCVDHSPLGEASRALLTRGYASPRDVIEMWHEGHASWCLRSHIGKAAQLTVQESNYGPVFRRYVPTIDRKPCESPVGASKGAPRYTPTFA